MSAARMSPAFDTPDIQDAITEWLDACPVTFPRTSLLRGQIEEMLLDEYELRMGEP